MRSRYRVLEPDAPHFITATCVEWLPVFTSHRCCEIITRAFAYAQAHRALKLFAWVILDSHLHAIVSGPELGKTIGNLKKFTAAQLLAQLEAEGRMWLLNQLAFYRAKHKTASAHQVWQEGVHPQALVDDEMMEQKLVYLQNNPVKRGLVAAPEHWRYSSAHEWLEGAVPVLRCDPWRQVP